MLIAYDRRYLDALRICGYRHMGSLTGDVFASFIRSIGAITLRVRTLKQSMHSKYPCLCDSNETLDCKAHA